MLTRKDFIKKADEFIKLINKSDTLTYNIFIQEYCKIPKKSNERFDEKRFREYIERGIYGNAI